MKIPLTNFPLESANNQELDLDFIVNNVEFRFATQTVVVHYSLKLKDSDVEVRNSSIELPLDAIPASFLETFEQIATGMSKYMLK
jgi:hypothetical protein